MDFLRSGKQWPLAIGLAITGVFCLGVWTITQTEKADITQSDNYMTKYQNADVDANRLIQSRIAFDKKYNLVYDTKQLRVDGCDVKYRLTKRDGKPVTTATMVLRVSRPGMLQYTQILKNPIFENGEYVFKNIKFPKVGRWELMLKVQVGKDSRFYDIKTDTRVKNDKKIKPASYYQY